MRSFRAPLMGLLLASGLWCFARATVLEISSLEDLAARSDLIVQGEVTSTESTWVGGHIETTIHVKVNESFKGTWASEDLVLTQPGGSVKVPLPISQAVPGLAPFTAKEQVILFLSTQAPKIPADLKEKVLARNGGALPALWTSPTVIGGFQGKYNIYLDPKTKKQMVLRQSALTAQGVDSEHMPPEIQAKIAESVKLAKNGVPVATAKPSAPGELNAAAPPSAVTYEVFRDKLQTLVKAGEPGPAAASESPKEPAVAGATPAPQNSSP